MTTPGLEREPDEARLMEHAYDGIREYDNPLPGWFKGIFVGTIVFSIGYWLWFHGPGPGRSEHQQFEDAWARHVAWAKEAEAKATIVVDEAALARLAKDPAAYERGRAVYVQNCAGCHLETGAGSVGPNLTDDHQLYGIGRHDLYKTIRDGVPAKGMLAWGATLSPRDLASVSAYVGTLRGQNLPGKPPDGPRVPAYAP